MKKMKNKIALISAVLLLYMIPMSFAQGPLPVGLSPEVKSKEGAVSDLLQEKISLDYKDVDIADILRSLSYTYGLNVVTSSEVKGKVTISLKDVLISEALDAILSGNGYNYSRKGNMLYISPGSIEGAQVVTVAITLDYLKAADAQNLVRKVLSNKGDIKVDEVSNMIVVTDYPASIEKLKELLKNVDQAPRQVLIEAKIVDMTSKDLKNLGVTWTANYSPGHGIFDRVTNTPETLAMTQTLPGTSSTLTGGQFKLDSLVMKGLTATATIDALIQDQKAHLLASPSIAVLNNREARIIIGEKVPYKERTQTTTGTTETTKYVDVGTTLRVTPSINADGYITLAIHPEVSSVTALLDAGPRITTREADTTVRVKEGETLVICGLIKQEDSRTRSRIPILGYIPIIGYLFSSRSSDNTQTELAVFITPKILRSRAEMLSENKTRYEEEAYVNIMSVADLSVQAKLFERAKHLQAKSGVESFYKDAWQCKNQALSLYECIVTQFPDGPKAPESAYQAAVLYSDLGEQYLAKEMCAKILSKYPDSGFAVNATNLQKRINARLRKEAREKAEIELDKIKSLTKEERSEAAHQQEAENLKARLQDALERDKKEAADRAQLEEERQKAKLEVEMVKAHKVEQARLAQEARQKATEDARLAKEARKKAAAETAERARIKAAADKQAQEQARIAKEEARKKEVALAAERARIKAAADKQAQEQARIAKEAARKKEVALAAERARIKAAADKQAQEQARIAKEEARKKEVALAAERARIKEAARQKAAAEAAERARIKAAADKQAQEKARIAKEAARQKAAAEAAERARIKAAADKQAQEQARIEKEVREKKVQDAWLAKEEARKKAAAEAAERARIKAAAIKQAQEKARIAKEAARQKAAAEAAERVRIKEAAFKQAQEKARLEKETAIKQAQEKARIAKEARQKAIEDARIAKEARQKAAEDARIAKEAHQKAVAEAVRLEKEARQKAIEDARLAKEARQKAAAEAARIEKEVRKKAIEDARIAKEAHQKAIATAIRLEKEARRQAKEKARLEEELRKKVRERIRLESEADKRIQESERLRKEALKKSKEEEAYGDKLEEQMKKYWVNGEL